MPLSTIAQQRLEKARLHAEKVKAAQARKAIIVESSQRMINKALDLAEERFKDSASSEKLAAVKFRSNKDRAEACRRRNEVILMKASKTLLHAKNVSTTVKLSIQEKQKRAEARRLAIQNGKISKAKDSQTKFFKLVEQQPVPASESTLTNQLEESKIQESVAEVSPMKVPRHFMGESVYMKEAGEKCDQFKQKLDDICGVNKAIDNLKIKTSPQKASLLPTSHRTYKKNAVAWCVTSQYQEATKDQEWELL
jgi:hypothetical protein